MISVFNASEAERHRFLHGSSQNDPSLKDFFTRDPPVTLGALKRLPVAPIDLVKGGEVSLFQVTSSANPIGALARISRDPDGALKLHWPFFVETHDAVLNHYIETESLVQPAWFHVGIRRSHGVDLSEELRGTHFIFDVQASATGLLGTHIVAAKELPPGRFIDQKSTWQTVYLCHLLLQKKPLTNGNRVLEVLDCAGASLTR